LSYQWRQGAGWEFVHVLIDDESRIDFSQILPNEKQESAVALLKAAVAYYASLGVAIARVMTDDGSCYRAKGLRLGMSRSRPQACQHQALHAQDNGKAERFIQTGHPSRPSCCRRSFVAFDPRQAAGRRPRFAPYKPGMRAKAA
jgi:transposase InsO family protein